MAKTFNVLKITPTSSSEAGTITIQGDWTKAFTGAFYLNEDTGSQFPLFGDQPDGTKKVDPTAFRLVGNDRFAGRYTVRTPKDSTADEKDRFLDSDGNTVIRVNELIKPLGDSEDPSQLLYGTLTNITTFIIELPGVNGQADELLFIYPKSLSKALYLDLPGHGYENWGELYTQNLVDFMFNHATTVEPRDKREGQLWFDRGPKQLKIWADNQWVVTTPAPPKILSHLHTQTSMNDTWTVQHALDVPAPHIVSVQVYLDRGFGPELAAPQKITFNNRNQLQVEFSEPVKGWAKLTT